MSANKPVVAPYDAIVRVLNDAMNAAVANGANSVSMPDYMVEVAIWIDAVDRSKGIEPLPANSRAQRVPQVASATKAQFYVRVSNISGQPSGVFLPNADGSAPDVELRSESLVPVVSAQRVPLTEAERAELEDLRRFRDGAFLAHPNIDIDIKAVHPFQRLADLSKEIGEAL